MERIDSIPSAFVRCSMMSLTTQASKAGWKCFLQFTGVTVYRHIVGEVLFHHFRIGKIAFDACQGLEAKMPQFGGRAQPTSRTVLQPFSAWRNSRNVRIEFGSRPTRSGVQLKEIVLRIMSRGTELDRKYVAANVCGKIRAEKVIIQNTRPVRGSFSLARFSRAVNGRDFAPPPKERGNTGTIRRINPLKFDPRPDGLTDAAANAYFKGGCVAAVRRVDLCLRNRVSY